MWSHCGFTPCCPNEFLIFFSSFDFLFYGLTFSHLRKYICIFLFAMCFFFLYFIKEPFPQYMCFNSLLIWLTLMMFQILLQIDVFIFSLCEALPSKQMKKIFIWMIYSLCSRCWFVSVWKLRAIFARCQLWGVGRRANFEVKETKWLHFESWGEECCWLT